MIATGADVRDLKARHGVTSAQLAAKVFGMKARTMERYVSGYRTIPPFVWWRLRKVFDGVDISDDPHARTDRERAWVEAQ